MKCIYCTEEILIPSMEHIIQSAFGSKLKSDLLLCASCNNYFSNKESDYIDNDILNSFAFFRNLFEIKGDRGSNPPIIDATNTTTSEKTKLGQGGVPIVGKTKRKEEIVDNERKITIISDSIERAKLQYQNLKKQYNDKVNLDYAVVERKFSKDLLQLNVTFGGEIARKAVLKNLYSFLFYLKRNLNKKIFTDIDDLDKTKRYIRYKEVDESVFANIDFQNELGINIPDDSINHYLLLYGDSARKLLFGFFVVFGHFHFSAVLTSNYSGENFGYCAIVDPITMKSEILESLSIPDFNIDACKNYPKYAESYFPIFERKGKSIMRLYYDFSANKLISKFTEDAFKKNMPNEGEIITKEHINNLVNYLGENFTDFLYKIPQRISIMDQLDTEEKRDE